MRKKITIPRGNILSCLILLLFVPCTSLGQIQLKTESKKVHLSISNQSEFVNLKDKTVSVSEIVANKSLAFQKMPGENADFGFTNDNIWIRFSVVNTDSKSDMVYFLETARPITDVVKLYAIDSLGTIQKFVSGDALPYKDRSFDSRKTIFRLHLEPNQKIEYYLYLKSDGELLTVPMILHNTISLLEESAFEQFVFGFFYGILLIAAIIYMFFFFAMRDKTFFYYSMYVVFIGLLQFSLDGYFYKFITPNSGWLSLHSVILFATIANFFLGRYAQVFLKIKEFSKPITYAFYTLYGLNFLLLLALIFIPSSLKISYPIANLLGLFVLSLIIISVLVIYSKTKKIDRYFVTGILFLIFGFVVFILKNFSLLPLTFWTENGSKLGTGMEVIFLSLSMANLIRKLKNEREELQNIALQKSEDMNDLKSYFLSNISHELRTPLNAIMSLTDAITSESDNDKIKFNCDIIKYSSQSLLSSVNDILDFSKIDKKELKLEIGTFNPVKIVQQLKQNAMTTAGEKGLKIKLSIADEFPEAIIGDAMRFTQIVNNIINNAVKFTNEGYVKIELDFEPKKSKNIRLILKVTDTGVGIPKDKMHRIYDSFSQESIDNKRKFGGLGLGLFIVKNLVDLHQGKIDIKSQPGLGTLCSVEIPYEVVVEKKNEITSEVKSEVFDLKGKRILVVEDNAMNQMVIKMITKKWLNTTVSFANNGEEGLNQLREQDFDIILMDLQMPVMDGYEATMAIRNGEAGADKKNVPIIAITADVMESTKERVFEIGMNRYLSKPVSKEQLYDNIISLVS